MIISILNAIRDIDLNLALQLCLLMHLGSLRMREQTHKQKDHLPTQLLR